MNNKCSTIFITVFIFCTSLLAIINIAQAKSNDHKVLVDKELRAKLPKEILEKGEIISVNNGSFPPYEIITDTRTATGAASELFDALGELLGIRIKHESVSGLASLLAGIKSGRYQFAAGPIGDFPERQINNDFIDYVREFVVFVVAKGNPEKINSLDDACGKRIAVMAAGSAEKVINNQSKKCVSENKSAVVVQTYSDQPTSILAVRSGRADAFFSSQAPLTYFVNQAKGKMELAGVGQKNGFPDLYQGAVAPKDSPLSKVLLEGLQKLFDNGTYAKIMKKWNLEGNMIDAPGININKSNTN